MRYPDWEQRLRALLEHWREQENDWGESDCFCRMADAAMAVAPIPDPMADHRGKYDTARGAIRYLKSLDYANAGDAVTAYLPEVHPAFAHRGDIGFAPDVSPLCLCLVMGPTLVVINEDGVGWDAAPRSRLNRAFKVGW